MRVRSVHFEAFKSLYDLTATFGDLTVITGANGSGKSNLVDGLEFIGNTYLHGLELAVSHGGGYENISHRRTRRARRPIRIVVEVELDSEDFKELRRFGGRRKSANGEKARRPSSLLIKHEFSIRASSQKLTADFQVEEETLGVHRTDGSRLAVIRRKSNGNIEAVREASVEDAEAFLDEILYVYEHEEIFSEIKPAPSELFVSRSFYIDFFWLVSRHLASIRVFQLSPHTSRLAGVASPRAQLERHGSNLPGAADYLRRNSKEDWVRVEAAMRSIIPTLEEISIAYTEDRRLAIQFREKGVGRPWNSSEVSDGTIQTFALLVAIFDSRSSLLVIEELENALHPWILRQLLELCRDSSRQIFLTSHSPVLLNAVRPESVQLMWMEDGRSSLAPLVELEPEVAQSVLDGEVSIFELYDSGFIGRAIPRGLV